MILNTKKSFRARMMHMGLVATGIAVNVLLAFCMSRLGLPYFFDAAGTIGIAAIAGPFHGIITAVVSGALCSAFNAGTMYFSFIYALTAIFTAKYLKNRAFDSMRTLIPYVLIVGTAAAIVKSGIQIGLFGTDWDSLAVRTANDLYAASGIPVILSFFLTNIVISIIDISISCLLTVLVMRILPKRLVEKFKNITWTHNPISREQLKTSAGKDSETGSSIRTKITVVMIVSSLMIVLAVELIGIRLYINHEKEGRAREAYSIARYAADVINPDKIDSYLIYGRGVSGYEETEQKLKRVFENAENAAYLYVIRFLDGTAHVVFDVEGGEGAPEPYKMGEIIELDDGFDDYLGKVEAGDESEAFETDDSWGWLITAACPLRDSKGNIAAYAVADISVEDLNHFAIEFVFKSALILAGIFSMIIVLELWITQEYVTDPITNMVYCVGRFAKSGDDQKELDENVRMIRKLDIETGDEIETLYRSICDLTVSQNEQMRNIRRLSDSTATMQDGMIITMADMVESRDSDTGEHVQKTAAYVKLIVEGLKKKGYYAEKITPKFMSDVVRSAPLHDIGKINIPDGVLNQPRKLTEEEFEIMKTHTTAGRQIIEKAINTVMGGNYLKEARNMAGYHHERWDGKGYPEGLHGETIPLSARIMAVADVFDALTSPRVYKPAFPVEKAIAIIEEGSGTQFDPKCVEVFMDSISEAKVILKKFSRDQA